MDLTSIKKGAKKKLKYHLFISILVCFIVTLVISYGYKFNTVNYINNDNFIPSSIKRSFMDTNNFDTVKRFINTLNLSDKFKEIAKYKPTQGVLAVFFNQITASNSLIIGFLNANNQLLFHDVLPTLIILFLGTIIYILLYIFVQNIIIVGKNRYFLEHRKYQDTSFDKVMFIYKTKTTKNVAKIMIKKTIYQVLWSLTIIPGIIKYYEYSMIPYILAENPNIESKDCFRLSKKMTYGYKMQIFKMQISLILWYILGYISFGISNIFYFNPYKESIYAEIYMFLRNNILKENKQYFVDKDLEGENQKGEYPEVNYIDKEKNKKWLKIDQEYKYSVENIVLFFFTFSTIGWIWEILFHLFETGKFVNKGTMFGPWLPIYGCGAMIVILFLKKLKNNPAYLFTGAFVLCGLLEYFTAFCLEKFMKMKWWDYSGYFLNINGRVCLEGLLVFALASCVATYFIVPYLNSIYNKIKPNIKKIIVLILIISFSTDFIYSLCNPNIAAGIPIKEKECIKYQKNTINKNI